MANLSILSGIEFYSYDVEVYDKVLLGVIRYKDSQIAKFKKIDSTFFENKSFYGINRVELVQEFVKYLSKFDSKIDKDSFLLGDVVDKRIKKGATYVNDTMIFMASTKQYDMQASSKSATPKVESPKEVLKLPMEYKDKIYKVRLNLEELGIGTGQKTLYDFNEAMLKSKVESFLKSYKKEYDIQLSLQEEFVQVGKLLIDVTIYNDHVEGFIDLSSLNLDGISSIKAEGKDKQELLNNIIQQLKAHKLTGKLNWGKVVDKTKKEGENKMANETTTATLKKLVKNLTTMVKKVGFNEEEIDGRIMSIIPNAKSEGVGVGGNKVDLSYTLPWVLDKNQVKKKKFAEEIAETAQSNIVIKEVGLTLYILDEVEGEINISISADVKWINTFFGTTELDSYTLIEQVVPIQEATSVEDSNLGGEIMAGNLLLQEFVEKIAGRPEVKLAVKIDKDTPFPVSFDVTEKGFDKITVRFENNATQYRASFRLEGPFSELQSKTFSFFHFLKEKGFGVTQEGLGVVVKGVYKSGDITIIHDLATLLDTIKGFSYNHANSFEAWAKKHKYGYSKANAFYQVRDIIPNYEGDAIVYKSGKSNFIAIPNDVEGIDGFLDAVKHAYTPEKSGAFIRFYFPNLEELQKFVEFANKIDKPDKQDLGGVKPNNEPIEPSKEKAVIGKSYLVKKGDIAVNIVPFEKGQFYDVTKVTKALVGDDDLVDNYRIQVLSILKSGKIKCKNITLGYEFKINNEPSNVDKTYTLVDGNSEASKVKEVSKVEEEPVKAPKEVLSDIEFYSYDVEVYDKVLLGTIRYKDSQIAKFKNIDNTFFENKSFYGINRVELIREFIKYLSKFDSKVDKDSFLLGDVTDKRIKKGTTYANDSMIFMASSQQYDAQAKSVPAKVETPKEEIEPPNREVERAYKAGKVKDPEHKAQLDRMKAYIKKIADVVDADNDFALRFLEEPKEFQKYKLPTVGVGLFYYGDKSATELEQNALYKKVYRGRGLSILRKFFKTTDLNGEKCLLVLFVDAQYAKETKAKLIKESFELGNKVRINGRLYKVNAIYEHKFAIETIAGLMYIDMDSDLIDITIEED